MAGVCAQVRTGREVLVCVIGAWDLFLGELRRELLE